MSGIRHFKSIMVKYIGAADVLPAPGSFLVLHTSSKVTPTYPAEYEPDGDFAPTSDVEPIAPKSRE
jgi:hypothetical protein